MKVMMAADDWIGGHSSPASRSASSPRRSPPGPSRRVKHHQQLGRITRTIYEIRTYTLQVGKMAEAVKPYDDADRRAHWAAVYSHRDFIEGFAAKFRPLLGSQEVKLLTAAPWGPHP